MRAGLVDVALTRAPFVGTGVTVCGLRADPVGALLRGDDPPARYDGLAPGDLADRRWFRFPEDTGPLRGAYWSGGRPREGRWCAPSRNAGRRRDGTGMAGMTLLEHEPADGLVVVPLTGMPPSRMVAAWPEGDPNPLVRSFVRIALATYRGNQGVTGSTGRTCGPAGRSSRP
ncbi:LysR substrate-binding domain-containing protein [Streptomyces albogriseolus]|uniref:LysR substrate-binding domain-containing protein n=1 Tax=Streptomyces albogriseolus TaxID=1887 RepID=UPI0037F1CE09